MSVESRNEEQRVMKRERKSSFWRSRARLKLKEVIIMRREHRGTQEWTKKDAFKRSLLVTSELSWVLGRVERALQVAHWI